MLGWALTFLLLAIIAGALGFGGVAALSTDIAQVLFLLFIVLFVVTVLGSALRGKRPPL